MKVRSNLFEQIIGMSASFISGAFLLLLLFLVDKLKMNFTQSFIVIEWSKMILIYTIPLLALKTNIVYIDNDERRKGVLNLRRVLVVLTTLGYLCSILLGGADNRRTIEILLLSKLIDIIIEERYLLTAATGKVLKGYLFSLYGNIARILTIFFLIYIEANEFVLMIISFSVLLVYSARIKLSQIIFINQKVLVSILMVILSTYTSAYMVNIIRVNLAQFEPQYIDDFGVLLSLGGIFGLVYNVVWQRSYLRGNINSEKLLREIVLFSIFLIFGAVVFGPLVLKNTFSIKIDDITIIQILSLMILFSVGHVLLNLYKIRKKVLYELCSYVAVSLFTHLMLVRFNSLVTVLTYSGLFLFVLGIFSLIYEKSRVHIYEERI